MSTNAPKPRRPLSRRRKWVYGILAAFVSLIVLGAIFGDDEKQARPTAGAPATTTAETTADAAPPTTTADTEATVIAGAKAAEDRGDYDKAIAAYVVLDDNRSANRLRRAAAAVVIGRARAAYRAGRYKTARRQARTAIRKYGSQATGATRVRNQASAGLRLQAARRAAATEARRIAAAQRLAQRRAARAQRAADEAAAAAAEPSAAGDGGDYAGMNCTEIGHSFNVTPGSDPVHDRDNDGVACESQ